MKKIVFCVALAMAALSFTSCKDNTPACWEVTIVQHITVMGVTTDNTSVIQKYGTESEIDTFVKTLTSTAGSIAGNTIKFDVTKKKVNKAEADCNEMEL